MGLFASYSQRQIKKIMPIADKIEALADTYSAMSDEELRACTDGFRQELASGKTLDDILPRAFAVVREADYRVLGKRPFKVQLLGGILLHQGRIAEMKTGEGKTLVATLPAYLNALNGKGVHIVTVNDYLARCGVEEMGLVYDFLGLSVGLITRSQRLQEKRAAYLADITYGTNSEFGFDYLRDNMAIHQSRTVQRGHAFAIVDEVDSILIDEARTPLIISGSVEASTDLYERANDFVRTLKKAVKREIEAKEDTDAYEEDYIVDEKAKTAVLTKHGIEKAEKRFGIENLSAPENSTLYHHINLAIKAWGVMKQDVDYVVRDGNVIIVDTFTGRLMPGRRYNDGLHQAIEAKEQVDVQKESRTVATITYQNYFRMYKKLSGMTGTALTEADEFEQIYRLDVVEVPTNKPMIRKDYDDAVFKNHQGKLKAIVAKIQQLHEKGQPVLVGTVSVEKSEELSALLKRAGVPHKVLNAKQDEREADIIAQAGVRGAVTIATNMAGRGTDILLGGNPEFWAKKELIEEGISEFLFTQDPEQITSRRMRAQMYSAREKLRLTREKYEEKIKDEAQQIKELGGLFVLGTERHDSRRIDNQLRGRSGRQGDPGASQFFVALDDDMFRLFGGDRFVELSRRIPMEEDGMLNARMLTNMIRTAQKRVETRHFDQRKNVLMYDDVMDQQRKVIYKQRQEVLFQKDIQETIVRMIEQSVEQTFRFCFGADDPADWKFDEFREHYRGVLTDSHDLHYSEEECRRIDKDAWLEELTERALALYRSKDELFALPEIPENVMREVEKSILLKAVDRRWLDHLEAMDDLRDSVGLNSYAQRDPLAIYRLESADMFDQMVDDIKEDTVRGVLTAAPQVDYTRASVVKATEVVHDSKKDKSPYRKAQKKPGPNDPCPCGSGKKYKKCCGAPQNTLH